MGRKRTFAPERWRLHVARLGSFLANARAIRDLCDDARTKYEGDYVFDRQYVVSVVDRVLEHLDALLFDARVLGADTRALERDAGECKGTGRALLEADATPDSEPTGTRDDPEYVLLSRCSEWLEGSGDPVRVMTLVYRATDAVVTSVHDDRELSVGDDTPALELPHAAGRLLVADLGGGMEPIERGTIAARDLHCRPLGVLLMGVAEGTGRRIGSADRWLAVVDRRHLSLRRERRGASFLLEATLSGDSRADWVFTYSNDGEPPDLPGLRSERTERGWVSWDSGAESVDQLLVGLGAKLLAQE